jgi:hypothetical protein
LPLVKSKGMSATFIVAPRLAISVFVALVIAAVLAGCGNNPDTAPVAATAIVINAPDGAIPIEGTMQFSATVTDANGNTITSAPTWTLVNGGGSITSAGLFTAGDSIGTFTNTIVATIGAVTSSSSVTVSVGALHDMVISPAASTLQVDATQQYTAVGHDVHGNVVAIPALVWSLTEVASGTVSTSGLYTAGTLPGGYLMTATSGTVVRTGTIVVTAGALATMTISPLTQTLDQLEIVQFTALGADSHGNVVAVLPAPTWSTTAGGTISPAGFFTAGNTAGSFPSSVHATSGAHVASASVSVNLGALASIAVTPPIVSLLAGGTMQYTAVGHDSGMNIVAISPTWSSNPTGGTISSTGFFTASTVAGTYLNGVSASVNSVSGTSTVVVSALPSLPPIILPVCLPVCGSPCFPPCVP